MVKLKALCKTERARFSPLLILFMVKFEVPKLFKTFCFSPLLILFMVKYGVPMADGAIGFSPLLILFMVKLRFCQGSR